MPWFALGIVAGAISKSKGRSFVGYFLLGLLLPLIGIILAIGVSDRRRQQRLTAPHDIFFDTSSFRMRRGDST